MERQAGCEAASRQRAHRTRTGDRRCSQRRRLAMDDLVRLAAELNRKIDLLIGQNLGLKRYARHREFCDKYLTPRELQQLKDQYGREPACTCGLDAVLEGRVDKDGLIVQH
jgi:hypothetical protein